MKTSPRIFPTSKTPAPGTTPHRPHPNGAPALPLHHPNGSERRFHPISTKEGVSQLLDIFDDVKVASDELRACLGKEIARSLDGPSAIFCKDILCHCQELIAIAGDLVDVCDDLRPGASQARNRSFGSLSNTFDPAPDAGGLGNHKQG